MFKWFNKKNKNEKEKIEEKKESIEDIQKNQDQSEIKDFKNDYENEDSKEENNENAVTNKLRIFDRFKKGLSKTRNNMSNKIEEVLNLYKKVDDELFDDLEEVLVMADVGANTTMKIIDELKERVKEDRITEPSAVKEVLKDEIKKIMKESVDSNELVIEPLPAVILVVGVNGVGKTTTIGKLSYKFNKEGKKVLIAAGDTFRAAAIEQLEEWAHRANADIISHREGADPAAVIYDGIQAATARKADILVCDTAGRLHNKSNLMNELNKIFRVVDKDFSNATKEVLLVLDATTGQNAINQAKVFKEVANITGVVLTKLDGTAKGGVVIGLQSELNLPVKLVGIGEGIDDLQPFNVDDFVDAIFD
ncbi:MAG: signal recognition particle-docking protein FtsY [Tissierellia bacterium]|nr:signal recognition particle-docking protein FtsY [Tissierellia bacterium]